MTGLVFAIVCGDRDGTGYKVVETAMDMARRHRDIPRFNAISVGSFRGTDQEAFHWAMQRELPALVYPAKWNTGIVKGPGEGPIRNGDMFRDTTPVVTLGFPGNRGTNDMMSVTCAATTPAWWFSVIDMMWVLDERSPVPRK